MIVGTAGGVGPGFSWRRVSAAAIGVLTLTYAVCLWRLEPIWADDTRLLTECAREFPTSAFYRKAYGAVLAKRRESRWSDSRIRGGGETRSRRLYNSRATFSLVRAAGRSADSERELPRILSALRALGRWRVLRFALALGPGSSRRKETALRESAHWLCFYRSPLGTGTPGIFTGNLPISV